MNRLHVFLIGVAFLAGTHATSAQTRQELQYDDLGRISQVSFTQGEQRLVIHYEYDNRNNITRKRTEIVSSVDEHSPALTLSVAPNPSTTDVTVSYRWQPDQGATITLTDVAGVERHRATLRTDANGFARYTIDTRSLSSGHYTVTITSGERRTSGPLIVTR